jgi:hypothetical protein
MQVPSDSLFSLSTAPFMLNEFESSSRKFEQAGELI